MKCECLAQACKAMCDCSRIKILRYLKEGERCVCEIQKKLKLPQNLVSHHLGILRTAELITARREGKWIHYSLNQKEIKKVSKNLDFLNI